MIYKAPNHCSGWTLSSLFYKWGNLRLTEVEYFPLRALSEQVAEPGFEIHIYLTPNFILSPLCHRTLSLLEFPQDKIPRVELWNQRVWLSLWPLLLTHQWKFTVKRRQEKLCANLLSTFPKDVMLFLVREEHCQAPFFIFEKMTCREI